MIDLSDLTLTPEHVNMLLRAAGHVLMALFIFAVFLTADEVARRVLARLACRDERRSHLLSLSGRFARIALALLGAVTALGTLGIDVTALVASLGLVSLAVGLAFKELLSSMLGGVTIIAHQPFRIGDEIAVSGMTGRVMAIGLRYTTLCGPDGRHLVPNAILLSNTVTIAHRESMDAAAGGFTV